MDRLHSLPVVRQVLRNFLCLRLVWHPSLSEVLRELEDLPPAQLLLAGSPEPLDLGHRFCLTETTQIKKLPPPTSTNKKCSILSKSSSLLKV